MSQQQWYMAIGGHQVGPVSQDDVITNLRNGTIDGRFVLRACIVNFRTTVDDVRAVPEIAVRTGERIDRELRGT